MKARTAVGGSTVPLQLHGIRAIDLDRHPGPDDWLVIAIGNDRLVPVRTDPAVSTERLAVVVYTDPPPNEDALTVLAQLVSADHPASGKPSGPACTRWASEAAARLLAAVDATAGLSCCSSLIPQRRAHTRY
jgi:hypothetical protein